MDEEDRFSSDQASDEIISQLYVAYSGKLRRMAYHMLHDYHRAEDAVHTVFLAMLKNSDNLKLDTQSKATLGYLCKAIRRTVYNQERDNKKYVLAEEDEDPDKFLGSGYDAHILETLHAQELLSVIDRLPPAFAEVMRLRFIENRTVKEVASLLEIDEALVRQRIRRARVCLKKMCPEKEREL